MGIGGESNSDLCSPLADPLVQLVMDVDKIDAAQIQQLYRNVCRACIPGAVDSSSPEGNPSLDYCVALIGTRVAFSRRQLARISTTRTCRAGKYANGNRRGSTLGHIAGASFPNHRRAAFSTLTNVATRLLHPLKLRRASLLSLRAVGRMSQPDRSE